MWNTRSKNPFSHNGHNVKSTFTTKDLKNSSSIEAKKLQQIQPLP